VKVKKEFKEEEYLPNERKRDRKHKDKQKKKKDK